VTQLRRAVSHDRSPFNPNDTAIFIGKGRRMDSLLCLVGHPQSWSSFHCPKIRLSAIYESVLNGRSPRIVCVTSSALGCALDQFAGFVYHWSSTRKMDQVCEPSTKLSFFLARLTQDVFFDESLHVIVWINANDDVLPDLISLASMVQLPLLFTTIPERNSLSSSNHDEDESTPTTCSPACGL
jgi:hypothetical protein